MRNRVRNLGAAICVLAGILILFSGARARQSGVSLECERTLYRLATAVRYYAQDYDEVLPVMRNTAEFQQAVYPYVRTRQLFFCPVTRLPYQPNLELSGRTLFSLPDICKVEAVRDAAPHPDGLIRASFLDLHVERGGVEVLLDGPEAACIANTKQVVQAIHMYAQDWDETLPFVRTPDELHAAIKSYLRSGCGREVNCPATHLRYTPNADISGRKLTEFDDYGDVPVVLDTAPHSDGKSTVAFLDLHVERGSVDVEDPNVACVSNVRGLVYGVLRYVRDNEEKLPPMKTMEQFQKAIRPYLFGRTRRTFLCPSTHLPYRLNTTLSGKSLNAFSEPKKVVVLRDPRAHPDRRYTYGYLDGHVVRK